jgi:hypothetical protein
MCSEGRDGYVISITLTQKREIWPRSILNYLFRVVNCSIVDCMLSVIWCGEDGITHEMVCDQ